MSEGTQTNKMIMEQLLASNLRLETKIDKLVEASAILGEKSNAHEEDINELKRDIKKLWSTRISQSDVQTIAAKMATGFTVAAGALLAIIEKLT